MAAPQSAVRVTNLTKRFAGPAANAALNGVTFEVRPGSTFSLVGPSGCGKSTTLRCVAGLERPDTGSIEVDGRKVLSINDGIDLPTHKRDVGMVFQSYALWPHMTVFQNVAFGLKIKGLKRPEIAERTRSILEVVGLSGLEDRSSASLSGGQQQRVAVARSLVTGVSTLLLDEPFSNLDARLRDHMRSELKQLQATVGATFIYVTHDQREALTLSDGLAIMNLGVVEQIGTPVEVYLRPSTPFVAKFVGECNMIDMEAECFGGKAVGESVLGRMASRTKETAARSRLSGKLCIRPEQLRISAYDDEGDVRPDPQATAGPAATVAGGRAYDILATVETNTFSGAQIEYVCRTEAGVPLQVWDAARAGRAFEVGDKVKLSVLADALWFAFGDSPVDDSPVADAPVEA